MNSPCAPVKTSDGAVERNGTDGRDKERKIKSGAAGRNKVRFALIGALRVTGEPGQQTRNSLHGSRLIEAASIYQSIAISWRQSSPPRKI